MEGHAVPDSSDRQAQPAVRPLWHSPVECEWRRPGVQPPLRLRCPRCRRNGPDRRELAAAASSNPLRGWQCQGGP